MPLDAYKNLAKGTLSTGYNSAATSIVLAAGHGARFPAAPCNAIWWNATDYPDPSDDPNAEIVRITAIATDTLTVTRAQEGTSATNKNTAGKTYRLVAGLTAKALNEDLAPRFAGLITESATSRTLALTDAAKWIRTTNASPVAITVPPQSSVAWLAETEIFIEQAAAGQVTVAPGSGVTLNSSLTAKTHSQSAVIGLKRVASDVWTIFGERAES